LRFRTLVTITIFAITTMAQAQNKKLAKPRDYYLHTSGDDLAEGTKEKPWKTLRRLNNTRLRPGDRVFLRGGQTFNGTLVIDSSDLGLPGKPVLIGSYGNGHAIINAGDSSAVVINGAGYLRLSDLKCVGSGRKNGNTKNGVAILYSHHTAISNLDVGGFQKTGLMIYSSDSIRISKVHAHDNGFAGIAADGEYQQRYTQRIHIVDCLAENNPGDPTNLVNHSGNGIIVGNGKNILIEYCAATNNGWDMPRTGNGPVGIWCYEADSVMIQHCIAYRNKTSPGGGDGGGFDFDGGVTNSVIQYCLSYENQGSGFGIFQYDGAGKWHDNTIRFCISENDGAVSPAGAGVFIWNSSMDTAQFRRCYFYNNVVYNEKAAAISYESQSANAGFYFLNNIFVAKDSLVIGRETNSIYLNNNWYSLESTFNIGGMKSFDNWARDNKKEDLNGQLRGSNRFPYFANPGNTGITEPRLLDRFYAYRLQSEPPPLKPGINLKKILNLNRGACDFNGKLLKTDIVGACVTSTSHE